MANKSKGQISFDADGKTYILQFTINSLCELEDKALSTINRFASTRAMMWAGLLKNHPSISLQEAGDLIEITGLTKAGDLIGEAFKLAFPEAPDPLAVKGSQPSIQTGSPS